MADQFLNHVMSYITREYMGSQDVDVFDAKDFVQYMSQKYPDEAGRARLKEQWGA